MYSLPESALPILWHASEQPDVRLVLEPLGDCSQVVWYAGREYVATVCTVPNADAKAALIAANVELIELRQVRK